MLPLLRKKDPRLDILLKSNTPPTDRERIKVDAAIQALRSKYLNATGTEYTPPSVIPQNGRKYHDKIQRYQRILAPARKVPGEVWLQVFQNRVLTISPKNQQHFAVQDLRLVSKSWNDAVVDCPALWCNLPLIDLSVIPMEELADFPHSEWALSRYLTRSRRPTPLPISFTFHCWSDSENPSEAERAQEKRAQVWIRLLSDEFIRWGEVEFRGTRSTLHTLLDRMRRHDGPFPLLSKFSFERRGIDTANTSRYKVWVEQLDLPISKAPRLKHFVFDSLNPWHGQKYLSFHGTNTRFTLPWGQLETFKGATQRDTMYPYLLEEGENLHTLNHTSGQMNTLPKAPAPLLRLTKLSLCFGNAMPTENIVIHLGQFTLPLLKELEIYWGKSEWNGVTVYDAILSLIQRSGCTLERLATEHDELDYHLNFQKERFQEVMYQCPSLTHLDIAYLDAGGLQVLVPGRGTGRNPPLPRLRVLTLRHPRKEGAMDPIPLLKVMFGRTHPTREAPNNHLEDIYIKHAAQGDSWRNVVLELGGQQNDEVVQHLETPFDPEFYAVALSWKEKLQRDVATLSTPKDPSLVGQSGSEIRGLMRRMGSYSLQGRDTRVLIWLGIPALLASVGRNKRGKPISGSPISEDRKQAEDILTKWKPFLLAGFRSSQYRYSFADSTTSRLSFVQKSTPARAEGERAYSERGGVGNDNQNLDGEDGKAKDWERILGRGDIDSWSTALKGAAWLYTK